MPLNFLKRWVATLTCLLLAGGTTIQGARAPEAWDDISFFADLSYTSEYIFRGFQQTGPAAQQNLEIGYPVYQGNIYVGVFASEPLSNAAQTSEIDAYIGYAALLFKDTLHIDFGQIYYWFPEGNRNAPVAGVPPGFMRGQNASNETFFGFCGNTANWLNGTNLNPSLYYYYDWNCDKQTVEASLSYTWDIGSYLSIPGLRLIPRVSFGYQTAAQPLGNIDIAQSRAQSLYYAAQVTLDYRLNGHVVLYAGFFYTGNRDTGPNPYRQHNEFIGGQVGVRFGL